MKILSLLLLSIFANHWEPDPHKYADNMMFIAKVTVDEQLVADTLEVGVFCKDECRGSAKIKYYPQIDKYLLYLMAYGENGDTLTFKLYDHRIDSSFPLQTEPTIVFKANEFVGSATNPFEMSYVSSHEKITNPSEGKFIVRADENIDAIEIYDLSGHLIYKDDNIPFKNYQFYLRKKGNYIIKLKNNSYKLVVD